MDGLEDNLELDTEFIDEFEKMEQFYKFPLEYIPIHYVYIDNMCSIFSIRRETELINNNLLENERLIYKIKKNALFNNEKYKLFSILKYNVIDDPQDLIKDLDNFNSNKNLEVISQLSDISFKDTIKCFQDLNDIVIIYYNPKKNIDTTNNTRSNTHTRNNTNTNTRKIFIKSKMKSKTTRKRR